ncbi:MAG: hypothetical protein V2A74_09145 [bacterium]
MKILNRFAIYALLFARLVSAATGAPAQKASDSSPGAAEMVAQLKSNPANLATQKHLFDRGNDFYRDNKFEEARTCYEALFDGGVKDGALYFNLGNTYAALGEKGLAVWMYEKALRIVPRDEATRWNLTRLQPQADVKAPFFLWAPFVKFYETFTLNEWVVITDTFFIIGCLLLTALLLKRQGSLAAWLRRFVWFLAIVLAISGSFLTAKIYHTQLVTRAVVVSDKVLARSGPGEHFLESLELSGGMRVEQLAPPRDHWVKIKLDTGHTGYVPADTIRPI